MGPLLSMTTSARARRSASLACAAMRWEASSRVSPRISTMRSIRVSASACTTTIRSNVTRPPAMASARSGTSYTTMACGSAATAAATRSRVSRRTAGCVMAFSRSLRLGSVKMTAPSAGRFSVPSASKIASPNSAAIAARPGVPSSTTSRASWSASMPTAPQEASRFATVLLPDAIPPVSPIKYIPPCYPLRRRA